jgi:hypothetical protein
LLTGQQRISSNLPFTGMGHPVFEPSPYCTATIRGFHLQIHTGTKP